MKLAIQEARQGIKQGHGGPFGSVIVKNNKVIGRGHNRVLKNNDPTCHGEMMAIHDACKNLKTFDLKGCDIYTTGEPCIMCLGALLWANIRTIYYGCAYKENDYIGFRDLIFNKQLKVNLKDVKKKLKQIDHKECKKLFDDYLKIKDRKIY